MAATLDSSAPQPLSLPAEATDITERKQTIPLPCLFPSCCKPREIINTCLLSFEVIYDTSINNKYTLSIDFPPYLFFCSYSK